MCQNCKSAGISYDFIKTDRGNYVVFTLPRSELLELGNIKQGIEFLTSIIPVGVAMVETMGDLSDLTHQGFLREGCSACCIPSGTMDESKVNHAAACLSVSAHNFKWQTMEEQVDMIYVQ